MPPLDSERKHSSTNREIKEYRSPSRGKEGCGLSTENRGMWGGSSCLHPQETGPFSILSIDIYWALTLGVGTGLAAGKSAVNT